MELRERPPATDEGRSPTDGWPFAAPPVKHLSIVVPYRDRAEHLAQFLPHMRAYFDRDKADRHVPYRITVVEQADDAPFNGGMLKNVGFLLTEGECDYVCFHDVDYLPIWADYAYTRHPTRLIWHGVAEVPLAPGSTRVLRHGYEDFFGAVVMMTCAAFRRVNGHSNRYWGWGFDDADLRQRCLAQGLWIRRRDGTFRPLRHSNQGLNDDLSYNAVARRNRDLYHATWEGAAPPGADPRDGLSDCRFELVRRVELSAADAAGRGRVELVGVRLAPPRPA